MKNSLALDLLPLTSAIRRHCNKKFGSPGGLDLRVSLASDDGMGPALHSDQSRLELVGRSTNDGPELQNAWGLVHGPSTPWWVSNNAGGTSTLYTGAGVIIPLVVTIPNAPSQPAPGSPTGVMFNGSPTDFLLAPHMPAIFPLRNGGWHRSRLESGR